MKWSKAFIPTLKEAPRDAEARSHIFLVKAGFIRQHQSGVYNILPLGWRSMLKIMQIIREEMNAIGGQELLMPALTSAELWKESGRWVDFGNEMFRLKDRKGKDQALAPTHEEIIADIARNEIRSYRDLPQIWYQIQTKFRDEPRPRFGLLRVREFLMKDSYSLDRDFEGLDVSYELHKKAYKKIFDRCGLKYTIVQASSGLMGGSQSEEFMVLSDAGEDTLAICDKCGYSANTEVAEGIIPDGEVTPKYTKKEKVHTPGIRTVEEVSRFLGVTPEHLVKSLLFVVDGKMIAILIRGDYEVNEAKIMRKFGASIRLATPEEVKDRFGVSVGFLGPLGLDVDEIYADHSVKTLKYAIVGANEDDYHLVGVDILNEVNIKEFDDFRIVKEGDLCPKCGNPLKVRKALEIGHIFKLGLKYSEALHAYYMDKDGKERPIVMGSYGIGVGRIMAAAAELYGDENGLSWPINIAPYEVEILELNSPRTREIAESIYRGLMESKIDVIWDDRDASPGFKFKDADLVGIPLRLIVSDRKIKNGMVELQVRRDGSRMDLRIEDSISYVTDLVRRMKKENATG